MADFDDLFDTLKNEAQNLVRSRLDDLQEEAAQDLNQFLEDSEEDLKRWTELLAKGAISEKDFKSLVEGQKDLAKMEALKQAGLAVVEIERLRDDFINRIVDVARDLLG